jgi:hypothetical protein
MRPSRRNFLQNAAACCAVASLPVQSRPSAADELQKKLAADPLRPQFHLLRAKNWMNDPNGPIYWQGRYHMFFQYNPGAAVGGDMHWAHAVSEDMIHWRHLPIAPRRRLLHRRRCGPPRHLYHSVHRRKARTTRAFHSARRSQRFSRSLVPGHFHRSATSQLAKT